LGGNRHTFSGIEQLPNILRALGDP
jgi:hypothetical protein